MPIARLIADPTTLGTRLDTVQAVMIDAGISVASAQMLDGAGDVVEITFPEGDLNSIRAALDRHFAPCDLLVSERVIEVPHLFVSDMDSTMIGQECIDELADFAGLKNQVAAITERAMQGELDFESALRERVGLLAGLDERTIEQCLSERIRPVDGARELAGTLGAKGCRTVLVTGGFHHFADPVAEMLGFDRVVGNRLAVVNGKLTGELMGSITDSSVKQHVLEDELAQLGDRAISLATGDGANDIPMLRAATYGVACRAKPKARAAANGQVERGDLTALLKLLNIPEKEWMAGGAHLSE